MTNFLHWRKMTWALVLWSGYVVAWTVITGSGPAIFTLWWLAGTIVVLLALGRDAARSAGAWLRQALRPARLDELAPGSTSTDPTRQ